MAKQHPRKARKIAPEAKAKLVERIEKGDNIKLTVDVNEVSKLTAGELRVLCFDNETHPKAKIFLKSIEDMPDDMEVNVHKIDVLAVAQNFEVVETVSVTGGIEEKLKRRGPSLSPSAIPPQRLSTYGETDEPFEPESLANVRQDPFQSPIDQPLEGSEGGYDPLDAIPTDHAPHGDLTEDPTD